MKEQIQKVLSSVFTSHQGHFPNDWTPEQIEQWDSMTHLNLVMAINNEFGIDLEFDEVMSIEKIGDIETILKKRQL